MPTSNRTALDWLALAGLYLAAPILALGCATAPVLDETRLVDLTHAFDDGVITWPNTQRFEYTRSIFGRDDQGRWYAAGELRMGGQAGTHLDAPLHLAEGLRSTADVPLQQLIGPIRVIDVVTECKRNRDYAAAVSDLARHEQLHGRIPAEAVVVIRTGWEVHWSNPRTYLGTNEDAHAEQEAHFPGVSAELAHALVLRHVDLVGIDGPGIDPGHARELPAERVLAEANVPSLANLAGVAGLPQIGATLIALPMKVGGGAAGPVRVLAIVP